jgi:hypothetical protein
MTAAPGSLRGVRTPALTRTLIACSALAVAALSLVVPGRARIQTVARPAVTHAVEATRTPAGDVAVVERFVVDAPVEPDAHPAASTMPAPAPDKLARPTAQDDEPVADDTIVEDVGPTTAVVHTEHVGDERETHAAAAPSGKCPKATTCDVHVLQAARWKTDTTGKLTLKWRFNDEGRRKLRAEAGLLESALKTGMAEWERWNSNVDFYYSGTTTALFGARGSNGSCDDGTNVIGWARLEPGTIAQVITCMDKTGKRVVDSDLALNVTFHWEDIQGEPESRHSYDIRSIVTHELGHVISLADLYSGDAIYQTMMGNAKYGETRKRTLALGDIIGIQRAYPCGDGDTCPRKGIVND